MLEIILHVVLEFQFRIENCRILKQTGTWESLATTLLPALFYSHHFKASRRVSFRSGSHHITPLSKFSTGFLCSWKSPVPLPSPLSVLGIWVPATSQTQPPVSPSASALCPSHTTFPVRAQVHQVRFLLRYFVLAVPSAGNTLPQIFK